MYLNGSFFSMYEKYIKGALARIKVGNYECDDMPITGDVPLCELVFSNMLTNTYPRVLLRHIALVGLGENIIGQRTLVGQLRYMFKYRFYDCCEIQCVLAMISVYENPQRSTKELVEIELLAYYPIDK